jgi:hypothetical protein
MPVAFMGLPNVRGPAKPGTLIHALWRAREMYDYLWHGEAATDPLERRIAYVADAFAGMLDTGEIAVPEGSLDPFINYGANMLARRVSEHGDNGRTGS